MWMEYFQNGAPPVDEIIGFYNPYLVAVSYLVAVIASYIALDLTGRLRDPNNSRTATQLWLIGGALAMGLGIWSMHFIGMLSFVMPMTMTYSKSWTATSMVIAVLASSLALSLFKSQTIKRRNLIGGGVILGFGIAAMHYTGMEAMRGTMHIHYLPSLFLLSLLIAISASEAAIWLALKSNQGPIRLRIRLKLISALIMGAGICGMHYTGMFAAIFTPNHLIQTPEQSINPDLLFIYIAIATFLILGIAFSLLTYREMVNNHFIKLARQAGMAEVATSILHNVGNILNSVKVSISTMTENLNKEETKKLFKLQDLLIEHQDNLTEFLTVDARGKFIPPYLIELLHLIKTDHEINMVELHRLQKNIKHIEGIVSMQQDISGISKGLIENLVIVDVIESAIDICKAAEIYPINITTEININPMIRSDKSKILQILVNLIKNAGDAVSKNAYEPVVKEIKISLKFNENKKFIDIIVKDNGSGINAEDAIRIFSQGFTTKSGGHGFGLHSSANAAKELGGTLSASSQGENQGATFILSLPLSR